MTAVTVRGERAGYVLQHRPDDGPCKGTAMPILLKAPTTSVLSPVIRELISSELEQVTGARSMCAQGVHIKEATLTMSSSTSSGSFWGTDEAGGQQA